MFSRRASRGFSLIEVVLAVGLVGAAMIAVLQSRHAALRLSTDASEKLTAVAIANEKLGGLAVAGFPHSYPTSGNVEQHGGLKWRLVEAVKSHPRLGHVREIDVFVTHARRDAPLAHLSAVVPEEM